MTLMDVCMRACVHVCVHGSTKEEILFCTVIHTCISVLLKKWGISSDGTVPA